MVSYGKGVYMNNPRTTISVRLIAPLAAPLALMITLAGCAPAEITTAHATTTGGDFPVFVQAATEQPAEKPTDTTHHGPGLYRLDLGTGPTEDQQQFLTCMLHDDAPGDVVSCEADFPVRWKELDGQHRQARTVIISQDEDGDLDVRAEVEPMRTIRIVPTDITGEAVIAGLHVQLTDDEARFSTDPDEVVGSVLITPDSFEVITETTGDTPAVPVKPA